MKRYLQRLNDVLEYVEDNILSDIDYSSVSKIACCPTHQFNRIFSFTLEMTLPEYVRRRRLTLAAQELREGRDKIIDIALKYGYESHAAFTRAFKAHHGVSPDAARKKDTELNLFMPITFRMPISLDEDINYRFEEGEIKMAKLLSAEFMKFGPYRAVGREIRTKAMTQDIPALWVRCFSDGTYEKLLELKEYILPEKLGDEYISCVSEPDEEGGFSYLVGMLMKEGTLVPEGFDFRDIPACTVAKTEIEGEEYDIYKNEFTLTKEAVKQNGYEVDYDNFFAFEVYTDEKFGIPKNNGEKVLVLDYYLTCRKK
jgi:AraC family transcriptional regulator